ncbi:MAG: phosphoribosylanthranilate isomerase [Deltaproteobacteria bacterium]
MRNVRVKICGITNLKDALAASDSGADALGFIFHEKSRRFIRPEAAGRIIRKLPPFIGLVGVFVDEGQAVIKKAIQKSGINCIQLHGDEGPEFCDKISGSTGLKVIKAFRIKGHLPPRGIKAYNTAAVLLDAFSEKAHGGTGRCFDWDIAIGAKKTGRAVILSGGLNPENIALAVKKVLPYAVDASSGLETAPGVKDHKKIKAFIERAKGIKTVPT